MFTYQTKISFYDCDPAGILFYGRVYNLCHSAYESLVESFKLNEDYWNNEDYVVPIIHSEATYHRPIKYGDLITIELQVTQLKSSSFELDYVLRNEKNEKCVKVKTAHVFIDRKEWKKKEMKKEIFESYLGHLVSIAAK